MIVTHNKLNETIEKLTGVTKKGQPWAKKNKERIIRGFIREMRRDQKKPPTLKEVLFYFWMWIKSKFKYVLYTPYKKPHLGDPCIFCGTPHDEIKIEDCPVR